MVFEFYRKTCIGYQKQWATHSILCYKSGSGIKQKNTFEPARKAL